MEKLTIQIRDGEEYIKLGQALKKAGLVSSGVDAKFVIQNGEVDTRRGKKLYKGDTFEYNNVEVKVED